MKRNILLALFLAAAAFCNKARAFDIYVYVAGNYEPLCVSNGIYKMLFEDDYTYLITEKNDTAKLANEDFTFLMLRKVEAPVGIAETKQSAATITVESGGIRITSGGTLDNITIIDASGTIIANISPRSNDLFFSTGNLPAGVYVVKASDKHNTTIKKVTRRK